MPTHLIASGRVAPSMTDIKTIIKSDAVMAIVSRKGVAKAAARIQPAMPNTILRHKPTAVSLIRTLRAALGLMAPVAKPRITTIAFDTQSEKKMVERKKS